MYAVPADADAARTRCATYLGDWDNFFYYMAKFGASRNVEDFGEATRHYKAVELGLSEINRMLGVGSTQRIEAPVFEMPSQTQTESQNQVREKEIIREKEVIVKIRCPYCRGTYDETLDTAPTVEQRDSLVFRFGDQRDNSVDVFDSNILQADGISLC
jgi:hypothetical protein